MVVEGDAGSWGVWFTRYVDFDALADSKDTAVTRLRAQSHCPAEADLALGGGSG